jgi:hypothetical protein
LATMLPSPVSDGIVESYGDSVVEVILVVV